MGNLLDPASGSGNWCSVTLFLFLVGRDEEETIVDLNCTVYLKSSFKSVFFHIDLQFSKKVKSNQCNKRIVFCR